VGERRGPMIADQIRAWFRTIVPSLVIDGMCPFLTYKLWRTYAPAIPEVMALGLGCAVPRHEGHCRALATATIGLIILTGIAVGMVVLLVGADA
jgi:hypothetical protein